MAEGRRGSAGTSAEGLDAELPKVRIALDIDLNVDLALILGPIPVQTVVPNLAMVVYEGPVAVGGDDAPVPPPPAATERNVETRAIVVYEGPAGGGDGAVREVGVLATLDGEAGQIVSAGSADADSIEMALPPLCHVPLQQVPPPGVGIPLLPLAGGGGRRQSRRRRATAPNTPVTARAWVRDELQNKHRLPRNLALTYIGQKVVIKSDINPRHARLLLPARARNRLRAFLYPAEISACGFDITQPKAAKIPGVRAKRTTYQGVPLSVYVSSGRAGALGNGRCRSDRLKLNKFHKSDATVINGKGYRRFMVDCGMEAGDGVEVWAFRWPPGVRLCLLIANRDGGGRRAPNP